MPYTFEQLLAIDLVKVQIDRVSKWVESAWSDNLGSALSAQSSAGLYESPLEATFEMWWWAMVAMGHIGSDISLASQRKVSVSGVDYRVDFALIPSYEDMVLIDGAGKKWPNVAVELDGHDYHERTKDQVTYRNQRDRALQATGWLVLHYSGSELVRNPEKCVKDAYWKAHGAVWAVKSPILDAQRAAEGGA